MRHNGCTVLFTVIMLLTVAVLAVSVPLYASLDFQLEDIGLSLETSQGRERKQEAEYDRVAVALPAARAELETLQPQADESAARVTELKALRKTLRAQKAELEAAATAASVPGTEALHE